MTVKCLSEEVRLKQRLELVVFTRTKWCVLETLASTCAWMEGIFSEHITYRAI